MSQDFKIQNLCDHRIILEESYLSANRKDISIGLPIASVNTVKLYIDGTEINREDYEVVDLEGPYTDYIRRKISLKKKVRVLFPKIEVSYTTILDRCPKCLSAKIVDDIKKSSEGDIELIKDEAFLIQQVEKYLVTRLGSNTFHKWMGTTLHNLVGNKIKDLDLIRSRITDQVNSAIDKLVSMQAQYISAGRSLTPGEMYGSTRGISVEPVEGDPTMFEVILSFTARSGKVVEYSQYLEFEQFRKRLNI